MNCLLKKSVAEFIGTFVLVFFAVGTAAVSRNLVATAFAFGLVIVAMAYSIGRISGCHINPAVSLGCLIAKKMSPKEFLAYVCAQILGGLCGAIVLFSILKLTGLTKPLFDGLGSNFTTTDKLNAKGIVAALALEFILTLIFVYVILNATDEKSGNAKFAGIIIGLTLTLVHLIGINLTGTSVNPARSIATAVADLIFSGKANAIKHVWIFIIAPLAGGAVAPLLYSFLHEGECNCDKCACEKEENKENQE